MQTSEKLSTCQRILQKYSEREIRKIHADKIRELRKNGFCLDMNLRMMEQEGDARNFLDRVDDCRKQASPENPKKFVSARKNYREIFPWKDLDGHGHVFLEVDPKGFEFKYVDFHNFSDVLNVHQTVIYLNTFWGIFVRNKTLGVDSLLQYDFDLDIWHICDYNLCDYRDGFSNRLPFSHPEKFEVTFSSHNLGQGGMAGAIFRSFDDFVSANRRVYEKNLRVLESKIEEHRTEVERLSELLERNRAAAETARVHLAGISKICKSRGSGRA